MRRLTTCWVAATLTITACFLLARAVVAQDTCDVVLQLNEAGPLDLIVLAVDYSNTGGDFVGDSTILNFGPSWGTEQLACGALTNVLEFTAVDDNAGLLSMFLGASSNPFVGPVPIVSCVFALDSGFPCPGPGDFSIVEQSFPDDPIAPLIPFPLPPDASIVSVTARTPICGDGFVEGAEECDDSNTADGDCCSSTCALAPVGTPCSDASVCTLNETCDEAARCVAGEIVDCDDGLFCTFDRCDPAVGCLSDPIPADRSSCPHADSALVVVRDHPTSDTRDRLRLGATLSSQLMGDPSTTTDYAVCVFDLVSGSSVLIDQIEIPAGPPWVSRGVRGPSFDYRDPSAATEGIKKIKLKQLSRGHRIALKLGARGVNVTLPGPFSPERYLAQDPSVIVQIENSEGSCWQITLDEGHGPLRHGPDHFRGEQK